MDGSFPRDQWYRTITGEIDWWRIGKYLVATYMPYLKGKPDFQDGVVVMATGLWEADGRFDPIANPMGEIGRYPWCVLQAKRDALDWWRQHIGRPRCKAERTERFLAVKRP